MLERPNDVWPALEYARYAPTVEFLHRIAQIGGKYMLFAPYSVGFSSVMLPLTPRGFGTRTLWAGGVTFEIRYDVLDDRVTIASDRGTAALPLRSGSVADFYGAFVVAASELGLPPLETTISPELPDSPHLDTDVQQRPYDSAEARRAWAALSHAAHALETWQAAYRGHRPPVGIMFGGFDVFAPRFVSDWKTPPSGKPMFMQNSETADYTAVGFSLGDEKRPEPYFFAYTTPPTPEFASADFGVAGAAFSNDAGLAVLPWAAVRGATDPFAAVLTFADAVYAAAGKTRLQPADLERCDGWRASRSLVKPRSD